MLPKLIERQSSSNEIPRSGKEGEKVNCYTVRLCNEEGKFIYLVTGLNKTRKSLKLLSRDNNTNTKLLKSISLDQFFVTHYYGLYNLDYNNIYDLAFNFIFKWDVLKVKYLMLKNFLAQYFFNKKELTIKNSMELLRLIIGCELKPDLNYPYFDHSAKKGFGVSSLMAKLFSIKWLYHPNSDTARKELELYLDLLAGSGDLRKNEGDNYSLTTYSITPQALKTIEIYEENERRHNDNLGVQRKIMLLTFVIAFATIIGARASISEFLQSLYDFLDLHSIYSN